MEGGDPGRRLDAEGWEFMFTASEPRLSEHVAEYGELGFEVRLVPVAAGDVPEAGCAGCLEASPVFAIWVRRRNGEAVNRRSGA
jgi:hypothetical protein